MSVKIIAEIGINHNGDIDIAKSLIDTAKMAGCDYVKFQKRTPIKCVPEHQQSKIKKTPWGELTYLEYKNHIEFGSLEYRHIGEHCKEQNIKWFASVWDLESAELMKHINKSIVKIPSALLTDHQLGRYCRQNFDKVILSTGMSDESEIGKAIHEYEPDVIMHTNSVYPSQIHEINLNYIKFLQNKYMEKEIGYSGHEYGLICTFATVAMGCEWIERHITLDHEMWGTDQNASVEPIGFMKLVKGIRDIEKAFGEIGPRQISEGEKIKMETMRK